MRYYAVIDTNVIVAALLSKNEDAATVRTVQAVLNGTIIPLYQKDILTEYEEVLLRPKFRLREDTVRFVLKAIRQFGTEIEPTPSGEILPDMDDLVFYEVALEKQDDHAYLVTGNQKHYPVRSFIVTPAEMMEIIRKSNDTTAFPI